jgi:hypothetical protein
MSVVESHEESPTQEVAIPDEYHYPYTDFRGARDD